MRKLALTLIVAWIGVSSSRGQQAPQAWTGKVSDSFCGASHQSRAAGLSDRLCIFKCLKELGKWVLVDSNNDVLPIATQYLPGLPLYAGRPVTLSGELSEGAIVGSRVQAYPPHLHLGHLMTNWRDTPGGVGLLMAALADARVAAAHAQLAARNPDNLDEMKLHAAHVLHALDPGVEPQGPGSGYGVRKAANGATQHLEFAAKAEGASAAVLGSAPHIAATLTGAMERTDRAVSVAQRVRAAATPAEAAPLVTQLNSLVAEILNEGLTQAHMQMTSIMKAEGLEHAPR